MTAKGLQNHGDDNSDNGSDVATVSGSLHSTLVSVFQACPILLSYAIKPFYFQMIKNCLKQQNN